MRHSLVLVALLAGVLAACSDDEQAPVNAGAGGASAGAAGAAGAGAGGASGGAGGKAGAAGAGGKVFASGASEDDIQGAFADAKEGDVITFGEGVFKFHNTLVLAKSKVTVRGAGIDKTILDFSEQAAGSEGLFAEKVTDLLFEGFTVRETKGNGIKVLSGESVVFRKVKAEWTQGEPAKHGPYGLYPVSSKKVLIEDCVAVGASDSGIYVGQSDSVVVRRNEATGNVAGIEIENTFFADVYENNSHGNTAGILIFDLPGLPQKGGHNIRVYKNTITENNLKNFAPKGNIVGIVPAGTGFFVMANHDVEVFENTFVNNATTNSAIISYTVAQKPVMDPDYDQYPTRIHLHDNSYTGGGDKADASLDVGLLLLTALDKFEGGVVPDIVYDGVPDPARASMEICIQNNKDATFADLHLDKFDKDKLNLADVVTLDSKPFDCALPALPPVSFPGL